MSEALRTARPDPRISRRRKAIERSRKKRLLLAGICAGAIAVLAWTAFWSPLLSVRTIRVTGSKHVTAAKIERAAHIGSGTNLLLLSTGAVVRATETLPWVLHAHVDRSLPGTVRVKIVERKPVVVVAHGPARWLVDRKGFVIAPAAGGHRRLPTLAGLHLAAIHPGVHLAAGGGGEALAAWRGLPPRVKRRVVAVFAPTVPAITFSLRDGTTVRYGPPTDVRDKNHVLLALLHRMLVEGSGASYIDVRVPTSPAVGPPQGAAVVTPVSTPSPAVTASPTKTPTPAPTPTTAATPGATPT